LYYLTFILLCTAPLSYGWGGGATANPDDVIWYDMIRPHCCMPIIALFDYWHLA